MAIRLSAPAWEAAGAHDSPERAAKAVRGILAAPAKEYLSREQPQEIGTLLARAEASLADLEVHV